MLKQKKKIPTPQLVRATEDHKLSHGRPSQLKPSAPNQPMTVLGQVRDSV